MDTVSTNNSNKPWWLLALMIIAAYVVLQMMGSCTTTKYIPVEHTKIQTKTEYVQQHDSIQIHDSVFIQQRGDTVYQEKWHTVYKDRWKDRIVTDTVRDSIPVTVTVKEKAKNTFGIKDVCLAGTIIALTILCLLLYVKRKL